MVTRWEFLVMLVKFLKRSAITQAQTIAIMGIVFLILFFIIAFPLYKSYQQKQTVAKLKILQSEILQAGRMYAMMNDGTSLYDTDMILEDFVEKYFARFFNLEGFCKTNQAMCWNNPMYSDMKRNKVFEKPIYSFELKGKIVLGFLKNKDGLIYIVADINGKSAPNQMGKDIFIMYFYNNAHRPKLCDKTEYEKFYITDGLHFGGFDKCGIPHDVYQYNDLISKDFPDGCNKKAKPQEGGAGVGAACLALIKVNNWTIDKNYPW